MKFIEKLKYKMIQNLYGKNINKRANEFINVVDEIDEFIGSVLTDKSSSKNKYRGKKRRRRI